MRLPPFIYLSFAQEDLMSYDDLSKILLLFFTKKKKKEMCISSGRQQKCICNVTKKMGKSDINTHLTNNKHTKPSAR